MNYNTGKKYNLSLKSNGLGYNSILFVIKINLYESIKFGERLEDLLVKLFFVEKINVKSELLQYVLHIRDEGIILDDYNMQYFALIDIIEKVTSNDIIGALLAKIFLEDNTKIIDELKELSTLIRINENIKLNEINTVSALLNLVENYNLSELIDFFAYIEQFEHLQATDIAPRTAISDFYLGRLDDYDRAYDWIVPFGMKIDWANTSIQVMPQVESEYIDMPNVDGSLIQNSVYKNRLFNIVAFSQSGLSTKEKEDLKQRIAEILDATKKDSKKLTFGNTQTTFDVKYSGTANIQEGQSYVKATIPLEAKPYGYPVIEQEVYGSGLVVNNGDKDVGVVHIIRGGCQNPSFQLGNITYIWNGTVPENSKLYINHEDYSCYLESVEGVRVNALNKLTGEFQKVPKGTSMTITCFNDTQDYITTRIKEYVLWKYNK